MIVDSSALIAILKLEPDAEELASALRTALHRRIPAPTLVEASIVAGSPNQGALDELVREAQIEVLPFDATHARAARSAQLRYGRGSGSPARLNFGDCLVYAVARARDETLLFKGNDFRHTDVVPALTRG